MSVLKQRLSFPNNVQVLSEVEEEQESSGRESEESVNPNASFVVAPLHYSALIAFSGRFELFAARFCGKVALVTANNLEESV